MFYVVYASSAVRMFSRSELTELLERSRQKNTSLGLTGMLLYKDGNFLQVLEGDESVIQQLIAKIEQDPRHTGFLTLLRGETEHRQFAEWSMGFRDLNSPEVRSMAGFSEFLNSPLTGAEFASDPSRAKRLLLTFKATM